MAQSGRNATDVTITLQGYDEVKARLREVGQAGETEIRRLAEASAASSTGIGALSQAAAGLAGAVGGAGAQLEPVVHNVERLVGSAGSLGGLFNTLTTGFGGLVTLLAATAAGFLELAKSAAESTRELENQATTLGLTVDQLEGYKFAFGQAGVSTETTTRALSRFEAKFGEAAESAKKGGEILQEAANKQEQLRIETAKAEIAVGAARQAYDNSRVAVTSAAEAVAKGTIAAGEANIAFRELGRTGVAVGTGIDAVAAAQLKYQKTALDAKTATNAVAGEGLKLRQAYEGVGVAATKLTLAQDELRLKQNEVIKPSTENVNAFTKLGVAVLDTGGQIRGTAEVLDDFIGKVAELKTAAEQAAILKEVFGARGFAGIAPGIRLGREELERLRQVFERFDVSPTEIESGFAKAFNAAFGKLETIFDGLKQAVGNILSQLFVPLFTAIAEGLADQKENVRSFTETIVTVLAPAVRYLILFVQNSLTAVTFVVDGVRRVLSLFGIEANNGQVAAGLLLAVIARLALVGPIVAAFQLLVTTLGAVRTAFVAVNVASAPWLALAIVVGLVAAALVEIVANTQAVSDFIRKYIGDDAAGVFEKFVGLVKSAAQYLQDAFHEAVQAVIGFFDPVFNLITSIKVAFENLVNGAGSVNNALQRAQDVAASPGGVGEASDFSFAPGHAAGGVVNGPSGRDRVPIWATAGEFVMKVDAVRRLGLGFMRWINGGARGGPRRFELGGLIGRPAQHFAEGGSVQAGAASAGGHVVVDLRLGGEPIGAMMAPRKVAERLVGFARGEQLRSAGRLPTAMTGGRI
jgi:hypothetical protein